ncbi:nicotinate-nicotinamide nucleotide adenylyltransferase [Paramaledivibacter caminithermalis]|uniref:nicotinate-nucleotide adenylyltransferase n=1 Tax=Paramaledivibacter caminithermalis (strain DSM 15212 / CIP 107654 / DViRD3) TaxID=1121301 RepID=A0A1M6NN84_PARC5|nr:cytidyltransferase [Paramaledivibacter caminithermalis]SHJ97191.1 Nicotinic acid mononucleotide adenylyltransferase [Paramaledivibacter caminithermalis DSM 15212]
MTNSLTNELYKKISDKLLEKDLLNKISLSTNIVKNYINSDGFKDNINKIVIHNDYSCKAVLDLCKELMDPLIKRKLPDDLLFYIYQYALSKSFPDAVTIRLYDSLSNACILYLEALRVVLEIQKISKGDSWESKYPLEFLSDEEENELESIEEYKLFKEAFEDEYIYEMMKLNQDVMGYSSLHHISGVHYLALFIARQLKEAGVAVDLGRVSGAAAGHDIGKFGCKGAEVKRVPYLHYYYTDVWFKKHNIVYIRNIAINHSTWDLEVENLSLENLILIYSDFRVKKKGNKMHIYSLEESFNVVLNKLDNLDKAKEKRYSRVYAKLKDFEDYMLDLGIDVDIKSNIRPCKKPEIEKKYYSLMQGEEIIENLKYLSITHNINLMYKLRDEFSLNSIIEMARSEEDSNNLRGYLNIFQEYSTYLTQKQKLITIRFLYEQLVHPEDDIRIQCAEIIGALIATFDEVYRKEVPENVELEPPGYAAHELFDDYLRLFLFPSRQIIQAHQRWIGNSIKPMVASLFSNCPKHQTKDFIRVLLKYYREDKQQSNQFKLNLMNAAKYIPIHECEDEEIQVLIYYIKDNVYGLNDDLRLLALEIACNLIPKLNKDSNALNYIINDFCSNVEYSQLAVENFLKLKIAKLLELDKSIIEEYEEFCLRDEEKIPSMFLSNLKTATDWVMKKYQVELIMEYTLKNLENMGIHTAMHFCNLLKVSASENVRNKSGEALIKIVPNLPFDQRNDIIVELLRALEIEGYQFTKYIPNYLGRLMLYLQPIELDELITDFIEKIRQSSPKVISLLLKTIGICIENYPKYRDFFIESEKAYNDRYIKMLGILLNGLVNNNIQVRQVAFSVIGIDIFGSNKLCLEEKNNIFKLIAKKLLTLLGNRKETKELYFLTNSAGLNHIYRFISDYKFYNGPIMLKEQRKIAFFPGSFDPFSLSHKEIAKEIRNLGFEVYLAIDEFSWSKRTQPNLIRRNIIRMSIADELGIYLFPSDIQINIANNKDLQKLRNVFQNMDIYIAAGSDVILNASAYKKDEEGSILSFSHLIFNRKNLYSSKHSDLELNKIIDKIKGNVIRLSLSLQYEDISSTQIRNYIDQNRDISSLVDPLVQKYIYENGLYRREPQYKTLIQTKSISVEVVDDISENLLIQLTAFLLKYNEKSYDILKNISKKLWPRVMILRDIKNNGKILGFSIFHWIRSTTLFKEFQDNTVSEYIRNNYVGRIIVIDGIFVDKDISFPNLEQIILTETLAFSLAKDYTYGIFRNVISGYNCNTLHEDLELQGFQMIPDCDRNNPVFTVNMIAPCTLYLGVETFIKEPFVSNSKVIAAINRCRKRLQRAIVKLYPGNLVLAIDKQMVYENLIKKICDENGVPITPSIPRKLGKDMCVPFGQILKGYIIPNTVTKSMHTEKYFWPYIKDYEIRAYPYYMNLENQVKMIKSFDRPLILVDDLLHKGYRIKALDPILKKVNVEVKKIFVGILSGRGKELMDIQDREVDFAYFIPKLKVWFNESAMYPFIGGDTLWRGVYPKRNLVPSINLILPYTSPTFIKETSNEAIYNLSRVSIENSIEILTVLEAEYQKINERSLTLAHLGEVFISPRCPDHGENMNYDLKLNPSHYLKNDLTLLDRLKYTICNE